VEIRPIDQSFGTGGLGEYLFEQKALTERTAKRRFLTMNKVRSRLGHGFLDELVLHFVYRRNHICRGIIYGSGFCKREYTTILRFPRDSIESDVQMSTIPVKHSWVPQHRF